MQAADSNLFRAAFLADALTLGSHWVYNQEKIARLYPDGISDFDDPHSSYHPNRKKGQFTHYGDQMMMVAQAVAATGGWSLPVFRSVWQSGMSDFDGYLDGASKTTLENLAAGSAETASDSNDLAGASRFVPTLFPSSKSLEDRVTAAREQTALTHGDGNVIDAAEFFVRATVAIQDGLAIPEAFQQAAEANYKHLPAKDWLAQANEALAQEDYRKAAASFGLTCHIPEAFPATLYFALRWHQAGAGTSESDFLATLSDNSLAGGDTSARAIPLAVFLAAAGCRIPNHLWDCLDAHESLSALEHLLTPPRPSSRKVSFTGANGDQLDALLELPAGQPRAYALFAHCFTCGKSSRSATIISRALAEQGIATLRFDFTGLGNSDGDFANTSFISNVEDLVAAAGHLRDHFTAPSLLLGHSLGGAAVLAAAGDLPEVTHVVTLGAPFDPAHVTSLFEEDVPKILAEGQAEVTLAGRKFQIGERFLKDLGGHDQEERIANLGRNLLIIHAPTDSIVGIENAGKIYSAAKHPKSFLSLPKADHLLTNATQSQYAARIIADWAR
ncbi:alpha/beta fold hydrolase [Roseibacillus persicicus]|uniref:alpha/beta fold hydrolase n=1 Tax=Roseibacillus persicicus TaxID=454148 RepID=UPI00280FA7D8|nr:alpha/beta fold hydrolase [Roseibacillus persicicus]MDQ8192082.1 alpha/beta fold hydrolase [Roseibacillus persicicus]